MDNTPPRKRFQRKKKEETSKSSRPIPTPLPDVSLSKEENEIFLQQIEKFLKQKNTQKKEKVNDYKILFNNINEFLESFIIFGYSFDGQRVLIQQHSTPRDKDAMLEFLKNVFIMNNSNEDTSKFNTDDEQ